MNILLVTEDAARDKALIDALEAKGHEVRLEEIGGRNIADPEQQGSLPDKVAGAQGVIVTAVKMLNKQADTFLEDMHGWLGKSRHAVLYAELGGTAQEDVKSCNMRHTKKIRAVFPTATATDKAVGIMEAYLNGATSAQSRE